MADDSPQLSAVSASTNKARNRRRRSHASSAANGGEGVSANAATASSPAVQATVATTQPSIPSKLSQMDDSVLIDDVNQSANEVAPSTSKGPRRHRNKAKLPVANTSKSTATTHQNEVTTAKEQQAATSEQKDLHSELKAIVKTEIHNASKNKGKGRASEKDLTAQAAGESQPSVSDQDRWQHLRLSEPLGSSCRVPPVFSHDGRLCFVAAASAVRIYSATTNKLLSSLNMPALQENSKTIRQTRKEANEAAVNEVTAVFINPNNILQLITTSLDGIVRVWDFTEGRVLFKISTGGPIPCAAIVQQNSPAYEQAIMKSTVFVAVNRKDDSEYRSGIPVPTSIVYGIPLQRSKVDKKIRLGKCKDAVEMSLSSDGKNLVVVGKKKIHIAQLAIDETSHNVVPASSFLSFEGFPDNHNYTKVTFTKVVCHPSQPYFATGDTRGSIRIWHVLNPASLQRIREAQQGPGNGRASSKAVPSDALTVVHWHAHAVSSLAFTPNGAYMLSGGEEAVLVIWQIESHHKEFVPRLGAPIDALSIVNGQEGEQQFVARLKGGAICFIGANTLKVVKTMAGVKSVEPHSSQSGLGPPLAIEPQTNRLVFQASHPSSIQFYSATLDKHVHEQDISPGNRVSRTDDRSIEPVRVEHIALARTAFKPIIGHTSTGAEAVAVTSGPERVWMATFDTWQDREYTRESHLKFWLGAPTSRPDYALVTRIDNPHGYERLSSMCFAPQINQDPSKLVTAAPDGTIKLWKHRVLEGISGKGKATFARANKSHPQGIWQCTYSLSYRSLEVIKTAFSPDASLLAVSHATGKVTLWDTATGGLVKAFSVVENQIGRLSALIFAGSQGTLLIAGGAKGHVVWDILTCEELNTVPIPASYLFTSEVPANGYLAVAGATAVEVTLPHFTCRTHELDFPVAQAAAYPTPIPGSPISQRSPSVPLIASIAKTGAVSLAGSRSTLQAIRPDAFESNAHNFALQAALGSGESPQERDRPIRLFDEVFGPSNFDSAGTAINTSSESSLTPVDLTYHSTDGQHKSNIFDEIPSHKLPSVATLWKDLLAPLVQPITQATSKNTVDAVNMETDDFGNSSSGGDEQEHETDGIEAVMSTSEPDLEYVSMSDDELVAIFKEAVISEDNDSAQSDKRKSTVAADSSFRGKVPTAKIAGKGDKKKKRASLLATMV